MFAISIHRPYVSTAKLSLSSSAVLSMRCSPCVSVESVSARAIDIDISIDIGIDLDLSALRLPTLAPGTVEAVQLMHRL